MGKYSTDHLFTFKHINIVIKHLSGRNPELAQRVASRRTFKIKKRKVSQD